MSVTFLVGLIGVLVLILVSCIVNAVNRVAWEVSRLNATLIGLGRDIGVKVRYEKPDGQEDEK